VQGPADLYIDDVSVSTEVYKVAPLPPMVPDVPLYFAWIIHIEDPDALTNSPSYFAALASIRAEQVNVYTFVASVPALRGCHTQAKSLDVLMKRIREATELCLEVEEPVANEFVGVQRVAVTA